MEIFQCGLNTHKLYYCVWRSACMLVNIENPQCANAMMAYMDERPNKDE